jgi:uncharacterized protein DUF4145
MKFTVTQATTYVANAVALRCPHCGKEAAFSPLSSNVHDVDIGSGIWCGQRKCPNTACNGLVFVALRQGKLIQSYPPSKIDFDSENIPPNVLKSFEEAISTHAIGCYMASALMVRRTLEEICSEKGATGSNLKKRIENLQDKIVIPAELLEAMDELRLLGNDAAHIEARSYDNISEEELSVAIEFTKEFLKGIYQYSSLLTKLRNLKK